MGRVREVIVRGVPMSRLAALLSPDRAAMLGAATEEGLESIGARTIWNVNSTAQGGGVAELLQVLLAYARGVGVDARWLVLEGDPEFFRITKRVHNLLHGVPGDGRGLTGRDRDHYLSVTRQNLLAAAPLVRAGDIVLLHDPQTAGMIEGLRAVGAHVVWRCHVGRDDPNEFTEQGWDFLQEFVSEADALVFSRQEYPPAWVPDDRLSIIPPSLDPFSPKNVWLSDADIAAALATSQLVESTTTHHGVLDFTRRDGSTGSLRRHEGLILDGGPLPQHARIVLQVSRWDLLKDMAGVLTAFADHLDDFPEDTHLVLAGPDVTGVSDDPEGLQVLAQCRDIYGRLRSAARQRARLCCLPMDDVDENAYLVNALQRHATAVVQKSLVEGFGLTVTEPMWKGKPVVASAVGGIQDQIIDGTSGLLVKEPRDLADFATKLATVLADQGLAARLGDGAHARVRDRFLGDRHLIQYVELFKRLLVT